MNITEDNFNDMEDPFTVGALVVIVIFCLFSIIVCLNMLFNKHPNFC